MKFEKLIRHKPKLELLVSIKKRKVKLPSINSNHTRKLVTETTLEYFDFAPVHKQNASLDICDVLDYPVYERATSVTFWEN
jgi:hypothetical protein